MVCNSANLGIIGARWSACNADWRASRIGAGQDEFSDEGMGGVNTLPYAGSRRFRKSPALNGRRPSVRLRHGSAALLKDSWTQPSKRWNMKERCKWASVVTGLRSMAIDSAGQATGWREGLWPRP